MASSQSGYLRTRSKRFSRFASGQKFSNRAFNVEGNEYLPLQLEQSTVKKGTPYIHSNISTFTRTYDSLKSTADRMVSFLKAKKKELVEANQAVVNIFKEETEELKLAGITKEALVQNQSAGLRDPYTKKLQDYINSMREVIITDKDISGEKQVQKISKILTEFTSFIDESLASGKLSREEYEDHIRKLTDWSTENETKENPFVSGFKYEQGLYKNATQRMLQTIGIIQELAMKAALQNGVQDVAQDVSNMKFIWSDGLKLKSVKAIGKQQKLSDVVMRFESFTDASFSDKMKEIGINIKSNPNKYSTNALDFDPKVTFGSRGTILENLRISEYAFWNQQALSKFSVAESKNTENDSIVSLSGRKNVAGNLSAEELLDLIESIYSLMSLYKRIIFNRDPAEGKSIEEHIAFLKQEISVLGKKGSGNSEAIVPFFIALGTRILYSSEVYETILNILGQDKTGRRKALPNIKGLNPENLSRLYKTKRNALNPPAKRGRRRKGEGPRERVSIERSYNTIIKNAGFQNQLLTAIGDIKGYHFLSFPRSSTFSFKI